MPVAGLLAARGPSYAYLDSVDRVVQKDNRGFGLRLSLEDFAPAESLVRSVDEILAMFSKAVPPDIAVFLDAESLQHLPDESRSHLGATGSSGGTHRPAPMRSS